MKRALNRGAGSDGVVRAAGKQRVKPNHERLEHRQSLLFAFSHTLAHAYPGSPSKCPTSSPASPVALIPYEIQILCRQTTLVKTYLPSTPKGPRRSVISGNRVHAPPPPPLRVAPPPPRASDLRFSGYQPGPLLCRVNNRKRVQRYSASSYGMSTVHGGTTAIAGVAHRMPQKRRIRKCC